MSINGNLVEMEKAPRYRKVQPVLAQMIPVPTTFYHNWGIQEMEPGSILIIDPATSTCWGCATEVFVRTYEAIPERPGFFRKTALIRAMKMDEQFTVVSKDSSKPEEGKPGDYLVENITNDGKQDRYLIPASDFGKLYEIVDA